MVHPEFFWSGRVKRKTIPAPSANEVRYINPLCTSSGVDATSSLTILFLPMQTVGIADQTGKDV